MGACDGALYLRPPVRPLPNTLSDGRRPPPARYWQPQTTKDLEQRKRSAQKKNSSAPFFALPGRRTGWSGSCNGFMITGPVSGPGTVLRKRRLRRGFRLLRVRKGRVGRYDPSARQMVRSLRYGNGSRDRIGSVTGRCSSRKMSVCISIG